VEKATLMADALGVKKLTQTTALVASTVASRPFLTSIGILGTLRI